MNAKNMKFDEDILIEYSGNSDAVIVPDGTAGIGERVFEGAAIKSIVLPDSLQYIGDWAFSECKNLSEVIIPSNVQTIYDHAFQNSGLCKVSLPNALDNLRNCAFYGCKKLNEVTIPKSVSRINEGTFQDCTSLTKVVFEGEIDSIQRFAFAGCSGLKDINLPRELRDIDGNAFDGCVSLADKDGFLVINGILVSYFGPGGDVLVSKEASTIGKMAFFDEERKDDILSITLPEGVEEVESWAFFGCNELKSITLPSSLTAIKYGAFEGCWSLSNIVFPEKPRFGAGDWFGNSFRGSSFPTILEENISKIEPYMDDRAFKTQMIKASMWDNLSAERKAYCYLNRRDKTVISRYQKFIREEECDLIGNEMLRQLSEKVSARETKAITGFLADFHHACSDKTVVKLFERIQKSKSSVTELENITGFKDRMDLIKGNKTEKPRANKEDISNESGVSDGDELLGRSERTPAEWKKILKFTYRKTGISITECLDKNVEAVYIPDRIGDKFVIDFKKDSFQKHLVVLCSYKVFKMLPADNKEKTVKAYLHNASLFSESEKSYLDQYVKTHKMVFPGPGEPKRKDIMNKSGYAD